MSSKNKKTKPTALKRKAARAIGLTKASDLDRARDAQRGTPPGTPINQSPARPKVDLKKKADSVINRGQPLRRKVGDDEE